MRDVLREKHGRWGLTARKKLGATAEPEYNVQLSSERGLVMKSLNALLNGWLPGRGYELRGKIGTVGRVGLRHGRGYSKVEREKV